MHRLRLLLVLLATTCNLLPSRPCRGEEGPPDADYPHTAVLYGRVVDEHDKPLKGVRVWPHSFQGKLAPLPRDFGEILVRYSTTTDDKGEFFLSLKFAGDQLGVRGIQVTGRGYVQVWDNRLYRLSPDGKRRIAYTLKPGEVLAG